MHQCQAKKSLSACFWHCIVLPLSSLYGLALRGSAERDFFYKDFCLTCMVQNTAVCMPASCVYVHLCAADLKHLNDKSHFHATFQNMLVSFPSLITTLMFVLVYLKAHNYKCLFSLNAYLAPFYVFELFINYLFEQHPWVSDKVPLRQVLCKYIVKIPALKSFNISCIPLINNTGWTAVPILVASETLRLLIYPVNCRMEAKIDNMSEVGGIREVLWK